MEPMLLGSPSGGSASPGATSPYLPPFLTGESVPGAMSRVKPSSPTKQSKHVSFGNTTVTPTKPLSSENRSLRTPGSTEKNSGPPTRCLFDTLDESFASPKSVCGERSYQEFNNSMINTPSQEKTAAHLNQDDTWVTVFGFPPSATAFIASQFSNCGLIVDKRMPPKGNWMHLKFQSPHEAHKALSHNGKIFSGSIMLGVVPCHHQDVLQNSHIKENILDNSYSYRNTSVTSPLRSNTPNILSHSNTSNFSYVGSPVRIGNARPLGHSYRSGQVESEVLNQSNTPQKSTSMVTKAMEYVFGW